MLRPKIASQEAVVATTLEHRIYIPENYNVSAPAILMVHGRTGDSSVMWSFSRCFSTFSPPTIAPQAPDRDPMRGYSWWPVGAEVSSPEEGKITYLQALDRVELFLQKAADFYNLSFTNLHAIGFSQGAGLISGLSLLRPGIFKSVALLAGFVPKVLFSDPTLLSKAKECQGLPTRYFIAHGTEDDVISIDRAREGARQLESLALDVIIVEDPVGHKVGSQGITQLTSWYGAMFGDGVL